MYKQSRQWEKLCSKWFVSDIFLLDMFNEVRTKNESAITTELYTGYTSNSDMLRGIALKTEQQCKFTGNTWKLLQMQWVSGVAECNTQTCTASLGNLSQYEYKVQTAQYSEQDFISFFCACDVRTHE